MIKNKVLKILFILVMVFSIVLINGNITLAKSNKLIDYIWVDPWFKGDVSNFHTENDAIFKGTPSDPTTELKEDVLENDDADNRDVLVKRKILGDNITTKSFTIRYYWLHGLHNMMNHLSGKDYEDICNDNDLSTIKSAIIAVESARGYLNTFWYNGNEIADNEATQVEGLLKDFFLGTVEDALGIETQGVTASGRATSAFKKTTGCDTYEEYLAVVNKQLTKLKLAEKYANGEEITDEVKNEVEDSVNNSAALRANEEHDQEEIAKEMKKREDPDLDTKFYMPQNLTNVADKGPSDMINDADAFVNDSESTTYLKTENLQKFSQTTYGVLLGVGIVISVIIGMILGIKIMLAPVSQKADAKKMLIPYVVGCIVVFGAFGIWRLAVIIMQEV